MKKIKCDFCDERFNTGIDYLRHLNSYCEICRVHLKNERGLYKHIKTKKHIKNVIINKL